MAIIDFSAVRSLGAPQKGYCQFDRPSDYREYVHRRLDSLATLGKAEKYDEYMRQLTAEAITNLVDWAIDKKIDAEFARQAIKDHVAYLLNR